MHYRLHDEFRVDAYGRRLPPPPTHGMAAAARYYFARDYAEAERCCRELISRDERNFDALHLLGVIQLDQSQYTDAVAYLTRAQREREADDRVNYHLGSALLGLNEWQQAEAALRRALAAQPDDVATLNNLSNCLYGQGRYEEALGLLQRALLIHPAHVPARYNMGRALAALDRLEEAVAAFRSALADLKSETDRARLADVQSGLGQALVGLHRFDEALAACEAVASVDPSVAAWNGSLVLLLLGRFAEGWRKYEGRWLTADHDPLRPDARVPELAEVTGKSVLLIPEQGFGDLIQFARYAPLLARQGARVHLQIYTELVDLMRTLDGLEGVVEPGEDEPPADIITPLLSLPFVFGTQLETIPANVPYLHAPPDRAALWRERLGTPTRPRVGLAWWGSQHIPKRSVPIAALLPLLSEAGVEFHALQQEIAPQHREWLAEHPLLIDHSRDLHDFADTAALISLLDLVITIDTSVAHLAGALGKPVWIMLQHNADWRWLLDRGDSPWYPTARLFRQDQSRLWDNAIVQVHAALQHFIRSQ